MASLVAHWFLYIHVLTWLSSSLIPWQEAFVAVMSEDLLDNMLRSIPGDSPSYDIIPWLRDDIIPFVYQSFHQGKVKWCHHVRKGLWDNQKYHHYLQVNIWWGCEDKMISGFIHLITKYQNAIAFYRDNAAVVGNVTFSLAPCAPGCISSKIKAPLKYWEPLKFDGKISPELYNDVIEDVI